jgi:hypothetical protein
MFKKFGDLKPTIIFATCLVVALAIFAVSLCVELKNEKAELQKITVEEVLDKSECGYIVKDVETWSILEPSAYLDKEVVEIAVCCDTEDTLCIFISIPKEEEKIIVRNP